MKIECENPMNDWKDVPPAPRIMKEDESHKEIRQGGVIPQQRPLQCENIKLLTPPKKKVESENPMNEWKDVLRAKKEDESLEEISQGGVLPQQRSPQRENTSILPPPEEKIETVNPVTDLNIVSLAPSQKMLKPLKKSAKREYCHNRDPNSMRM